jgi:hypothetical protein
VSSNVGNPEPLGALRREIRDALEAGLLRLAQLGSVARRGTRQPCFICQGLIEPGELEREVKLRVRERPGAVIVHEPCYLLWRVETMAKAARQLAQRRPATRDTAAAVAGDRRSTTAKWRQSKRKSLWLWTCQQRQRRAPECAVAQATGLRSRKRRGVVDRRPGMPSRRSYRLVNRCSVVPTFPRS